MKNDTTKTFKLNVDYKLNTGDASDEDVQVAKAELTRDYIEYAVTASHNQGLDSQYRRLYGTLQNKIQSAIDSKTFEVEMTEGEITFVKMAFADEKVKFVPAKIAFHVVALEDAIALL